MKNLAIFALLCTVLFTLCACTGNPTPPNEANATKAYENFVKGKNAAADTEGKSLSVRALSTRDGQPGIDRYTMRDLSGDGVPELITEGAKLHIFTFTGKRVELAHTVDTSFKTSSADILESGAILYKYVSDGTHYEYITFTTDCRPQITTFFDAENAKEGSTYSFNNHPLSKEEFDQQVSPFLTEKQAELTWNNAE